MIEKEKLSIEKLRTYPGFEDCTDECAEKAIEVVESLAKILLELYKKEKKIR